MRHGTNNFTSRGGGGNYKGVKTFKSGPRHGQEPEKKKWVPRTQEEEEEEEEKRVAGIPRTFLQTIEAQRKDGTVTTSQVLKSFNTSSKLTLTPLEMAQRMGREPEPEMFCSVCGKLASQPVKCKWDDMLRTACRSCIESKCTEINNFTCPLTGETECDVENGLIEDEGVKNKIKEWEKEIRMAYKEFEARERSTKAKSRIAMEMEKLIESDTEEEEFEDVKKTNEELEGFGRDVFDDVEEEKEKRLKEEKKRKKEETERRKKAAEENEKMKARAALEASNQKAPEKKSIEASQVVQAPRPPTIEPSQIYNPNINPITRLPRGYMIGPAGSNLIMNREQLMWQQQMMPSPGVGPNPPRMPMLNPQIQMAQMQHQQRMQQGQNQQMQQMQMQQQQRRMFESKMGGQGGASAQQGRGQQGRGWGGGQGSPPKHQMQTQQRMQQQQQQQGGWRGGPPRGHQGGRGFPPRGSDQGGRGFPPRGSDKGGRGFDQGGRGFPPRGSDQGGRGFPLRGSDQGGRGFPPRGSDQGGRGFPPRGYPPRGRGPPRGDHRGAPRGAPRGYPQAAGQKRYR